MKMHDDEVAIDEHLVRRLLAAQFPELTGMAVCPVRPSGTVNAIFRIGAELCARLPRARRWLGSVEHEWQWLPRLSGSVTLQIPAPVALGQPTAEYPFSWAIYRWLDGRPWEPGLADERQAAADLAQFVTELRQITPDAGAPAGGRRPLRELDAATRASIKEAALAIDGPGALSALAGRTTRTRLGRPGGVDPQRPASAKPAGECRADQRHHRLRGRRPR